MSRLNLPASWARPASWMFLWVTAAILYYRHLAGFDFEAGAIPQDFSVYIKAVRLYRSGATPYDPHDFLTYKYSPASMILFYWLPLKPISAWLVTKFFYVVGWAMALGVAARVKSWEQFGLLFFGVVVSWKGVIEGLDFGQFEFALLFCGLLAADLLERRPRLAGFLAGTLPWLKLPWGLVTVPFLLKRRAWGGILAASVFWGLALPIVWFGPGRYLGFIQDWREVLRTQPAYLYFHENANQSVWAAISRLLHTDSLFCVGLLGLLVLASLGWRLLCIACDPQRQSELPAVWVTRWMILCLLANPLSWRWASMLVVGAPLGLNHVEWKKRPRLNAVYLGLIFILFLLQLNPVVRMMGFNHWTRLHDYGLVTFYWILILLITL